MNEKCLVSFSLKKRKGVRHETLYEMGGEWKDQVFWIRWNRDSKRCLYEMWLSPIHYNTFLWLSNAICGSRISGRVKKERRIRKKRERKRERKEEEREKGELSEGMFDLYPAKWSSEILIERNRSTCSNRKRQKREGRKREGRKGEGRKTWVLVQS